MTIRIKSIEVDNFKSLVAFRLELPKFGCLIGLNGAGKSTVLQFINFLSHLIDGDVEDWLSQRRWKPGDLKSKTSRRRDIRFTVRFCTEGGEDFGRWEATYKPSESRCVKETFEAPDFSMHSDGSNVLFTNTKDGFPSKNHKEFPIAFDYSDSIISSIMEDRLPTSILNIKRFLRQVRSLELLNPESLRQKNRGLADDLGLGGENLAAYIDNLPLDQRNHLNHLLGKAYPHLTAVRVRSLRAGWKQLEIEEIFPVDIEDGRNHYLPEFQPTMSTEARHINDGMLRLIAVLSELLSSHRFLLFDEIENGINPELIEYVVDAIVSSSKQILVTTHSPMILNYLEDKIAEDGVIYIYKTAQGHTKAIPFFSIPSLKEKLTVMGPGEAFVDTSLTELAQEIGSIGVGR